MAVNYLVFDGVKSSDYGIYISGEAVFDAPERDAEMITIPGRDGDLLLDRGRYKNMKVTYPAFCYKTTYSSFITNIDNFRNAIASKKGYKRLTDTFHTSEYRMASFIDGIEINPILYNSGATFEITFECKPQRYLTSGESAVAVADGGTITNPTLYASNPVLQVTGYGDLNVNGYDITIQNETLGRVRILNEGTDSEASDTMHEYLYFNNSLYNSTDSIDVGNLYVRARYDLSGSGVRISSLTLDSHTSDGTPSLYITPDSKGGIIKVRYTNFTLASATATKTYTSTTVADIVIDDNGTTVTGKVSITNTITYNGDGLIYFYVRVSNSPGPLQTYLTRSCSVDWSRCYANSTVSILGTPTYIDCDLGEAYKIENNSVIDLNSYIDLGSDLPKLSPGSNAVTYDNTVTDFKIVPNWWQL